MPSVIVSVLAHPDDAEFLCAGTLIRLKREHGWDVHIASMTAGDCGSSQLGPEAISQVRRVEGTKAAALLGASYYCLEEKDLLISYNERPLEKVVRLLREVRPTVVITHSPADYMLDHEMTSTLARAASFAAAAPNFLCERGHPPALEHIPHVYYCDPIEGKDLMGQPVPYDFVVDISSAIELKAQMLAQHSSQREWLMRQHGMDHYVESMRAWCKKRGEAHQMPYAEGFRQHRGHSYPQDGLLQSLLCR